MPATLARRFAQRIDVERRDDAPVAFVRRVSHADGQSASHADGQSGRRHDVLAVLAHWWEAGPWWEKTDLTSGVRDDERELWRVEAAARGRPSAIVELCFSWSTGRWTVTAVHD